MLLLDIFEEHLDDAKFLFHRRGQILRSPGVGVGFLAQEEERLKAHLDGLVVGGQQSWSVCAPLLAGKKAEEVFVAAWVALEMNTPEAVAALGEACAQVEGDSAKGLTWALRLARAETVIPLSRTWLQAVPKPRSAPALDALTFHGEDPGSILLLAMEAEPPVAKAALRGARRLGIDRAEAHLPRLSGDADPSVAEKALVVLALRDPGKARSIAREWLVGGGLRAESGARLLGAIGEASDASALRTLAGSKDRESARSAVLALGNLGIPETISVLLDLLQHETLGGVAGVALRRILGPGWPWTPAQRPSGPPDAPWHPDDELPVWKRAPLESEWAKRGTAFAGGTMYRDGIPRAGAGAAGSPCCYRPSEALEAVVLAGARAMRDPYHWIRPLAPPPV